jgi:DNA modification methylase
MCGSGTTCVIAKELGRNFIGIELDKNYYEMALKRVNLTIADDTASFFND